MSLTITLSVRFLENETNDFSLTPDYEKTPLYLRYYFSGDVDIIPSVTQIYVPRDSNSFKIQLSTSNCNKVLEAQDASICFQLLCSFEIFDDKDFTSYGYFRKDPIGEGLIRLIQLTDQFKERGSELLVKIDDNTPYEEDLRLHRCIIGVICTGVELSSNVRIVGKLDLNVDIERERKMTKLKDEFTEFYQTHGPTRPKISTKHIPTWRENYLVNIPACMWAFRKTDVMPYYKQSRNLLKRCLYIILDFHNWNKEDFFKTLNLQFASQSLLPDFLLCIKIIASAFCLVSNASDYISDLSAGHDTERFKVIRLGLYAGDCEDVAMEIYQQYMEFISDTYNGMSVKFKVLQKVCKLYIPLVVTGTATMPSLKKEESKGDKIICHVYVSMRPRFDVINRLKASTHSSIIRNIEKGVISEVPFFIWENDLPVIMQEGTSMSCPLLNPLWTYTTDRSIGRRLAIMEELRVENESKYPNMAKLMIEIGHGPYTGQAQMKDDYNIFVKVVNNVWTDIFKKYGLRTIDFSVGYGINENHVYGVDVFKWCQNQNFDDFIFFPVSTMTPEEISIAIKTIEKNPPFIPIDVSNAIENPNAIPYNIRELTQKYPPLNKEDNSQHWTNGYISYRINRWERITSALYNDIKSSLLDRSFIAIRAKHYEISKDRELYIGEIRLYPK